jgi:hypothetical protein
MQKKRISLHNLKKQKKEERRRRNRRQALETVRGMTDSELELVAKESTNDTLHAQARKILALRQQARQKKNEALRPGIAAQTARTEQGAPPPVAPDFAQPDSWRDE